MIVLVAGLPGVGKSFFARKLMTKLGGIYINSDQIRRMLQGSGRYSLEDKLAVYKEMLLQTTRAIEENLNVIVDATFYHHTMREMFVRLASAYNTDICVIEVIADENLIRERLQKPREDSEADYRVYQQIRDDFEEITMPHLTLQSTNDNIDSILKRALTYISDERE